MLGLRQPGWARRLAFVAITILTLVAFDAVPAAAVFKGQASQPLAHIGLARGANTQLTLTSTGPGECGLGLHSQPGQRFRPDARATRRYHPPEFLRRRTRVSPAKSYGTPVGGGAQIKPLLHRHRY